MVTELTTITPFKLPIIDKYSWPVQGQWTYEDHLRLPADKHRYEIIKGVLYMTHAPSYDHQYTVTELIIRLGSFVKEHKLGVVLTAPFEVHLSDTTRPVQPDIIFIKAAKQPVSGSQVFAGVPDLLIEVLSPSSIRTDRYVKFDVYEQIGVPEYWIVNPKTRSVEVYTLSGGEYALLSEFTAAEIVTSVVLSGLSMVTDSLFA